MIFDPPSGRTFAKCLSRRQIPLSSYCVFSYGINSMSFQWSDELPDSDPLLFTGGEGLCGVNDWIPPKFEGAAPFGGLDRSVDRVRLAGGIRRVNGMPYEEALMVGVRDCANEGGHPDFVCVPESWGATPCSFYGPRGPVDVEIVPDIDDAFVIQSDMWMLLQATDGDLSQLPRFILTCTRPALNCRLVC